MLVRDRSAVCVFAYLISKRGAGLDEAAGLLKDRVKGVRVSSGFQAYLQKVKPGKGSLSPAASPSDGAESDARSSLPAQGKQGSKRKQPKSRVQAEPHYIECPHCGLMLQIANVRCGTFRCGAYKRDMRPLPPHSSREVCENAVANGEIYGCGMPFKYNGKDTPISLTWEESKSWANNRAGSSGAGKGEGRR